jgi:hypothetical protein
MQIDMGFTYMGILIFTPYMHDNMGFTYMGIFVFYPNMGFTYIGTWCFLPHTYMRTWPSSLRRHGDMGFYHPT